MKNRQRPSDTTILLILGALSTISPLSIDMYLPALAQIAQDLHTTVAKVSLSLSSYFIGLAVGQIFYGPLLDRYGRKRPLYGGLALYLAASVGCLRSSTVEELIVWRGIQALGGCAAQVACMTLVLDFFPIKESARIFSALILVISVSPLLAPTAGSYIAIHWGWSWIFISLALITLAVWAVTAAFLPDGRPPNPAISLNPTSIFAIFGRILKEPQFYTYAFAGAFSFAGLLAYVAGSPIIFMKEYGVSPTDYGRIFALLSVGFIGSSQLNALAVKRWSNERIFMAALVTQTIVGFIFITGSLLGWWGLWSTITLLFISLACLGISYPNAATLALSPFTETAGSASALLGSLQIGVASLASSSIGLVDAQDSRPIIAILAVTAFIGLVIHTVGKRRIRHPLLHSDTPVILPIE